MSVFVSISERASPTTSMALLTSASPHCKKSRSAFAKSLDLR